MCQKDNFYVTDRDGVCRITRGANGMHSWLMVAALRTAQSLRYSDIAQWGEITITALFKQNC